MNLFFYKKSFCALLLITTFTLLRTGEVQAQMFSVQENETVRSRSIPLNNIYIGVEPADFAYKGGDAEGPSAGLFEFDGPLIRLKYETIGLEAFIGAGGRLTGIDDIAFFDVGIRARRGLALIRNENLRVQLPLQIKSSLTSVSSDQIISTGSQFRQGTLTVGGGGKIDARFSDNVRFSAGVVPNYGFSFATGGTFGGQIFEVETVTRLYFDRVFGKFGISLGWDYTYKRFDVEENEFDYNFTSQGFLVGITF